MHPQANVITLGVEDVDRAKRFATEGLGLPIRKDAGQFVTLALGDADDAPALALYPRAALADDAGADAGGTGFRSSTLSYLVGSAEQVDAVLAAATAAGARTVKPAKRALWGGYSGTFADPDGHMWKVASSKGPARFRRRSPETVAPELPDGAVLTIGVADIARSKRFYGEGLGCPVDKDYAKFVSFDLGTGSWGLGLYRREALAADAGVDAAGTGFRAVTGSAVVDTTEEVDALLAAAGAAGGHVVKAAGQTPWSGYSGYFADPDGHLWKVATVS
jgi:uncharacterized protein